MRRLLFFVEIYLITEKEQNQIIMCYFQCIIRFRSSAQFEIMGGHCLPWVHPVQLPCCWLGMVLPEGLFRSLIITLVPCCAAALRSVPTPPFATSTIDSAEIMEVFSNHLRSRYHCGFSKNLKQLTTLQKQMLLY